MFTFQKINIMLQMIETNSYAMMYEFNSRMNEITRLCFKQ